GHAEMNNAFGAHGKVRRIDDPAPFCFRRLRAADELWVQQRSEGKSAEAISCAAKKGATIDTAREAFEIKRLWHGLSYQGQALRARHSATRTGRRAIQE